MGALSLRNCPVRFGFHRMDKVRKFNRILDKENRRVIAHQVENTLFGIEFGGEAADITHGIGRARAALNGGEADKNRGDFFRRGQKIGFGNFFQAFVRLEIAVRGGTASMNDTLGNAFMVKVGNFLT